MTIEKKTTIEVMDDSGNKIKPGDVVLIRVGSEDILCQYDGIERGYFVTETLGEFGFEKETNRYRPSSITGIEDVEGTEMFFGKGGLDGRV